MTALATLKLLNIIRKVIKVDFLLLGGAGIAKTTTLALVCQTFSWESIFIYLADRGARGCSTNTVVIHSLEIYQFTASHNSSA